MTVGGQLGFQGFDASLKLSDPPVSIDGFLDEVAPLNHDFEPPSGQESLSFVGEDISCLQGKRADSQRPAGHLLRQH